MEAIRTWNQLEARFAAVLGDVEIDEEPFPASGRCACGSSSFSVLELGYVRDTDLGLEFDEPEGDEDDVEGEPSQYGPDVQDRTITSAWASTSGWSDFSDEGLYEAIVCDRCNRLYDSASLDFEWT